MGPHPVQKEEDIAERIRDWVQKCDRLARHGSQYELPTMYKTVALGKILIGETKKAYEAWELEGLQYDRLIAKLRDYARSKRLDGEAKLGKQAVDINTIHDGGAQGESQGDKEE